MADTATAPATQTATTQPTPDEALERLKQGNARFTHDEGYSADLSSKRRMELAKSQHPFATLVGCSDSRVGPEQLFGVGLGDLFIVRSAGNNVDTAGMGSIEYSVVALNVPLIVVLGHEACGAVAAATQVVTEDKRFPGSIGPMIAPIIPSVLAAQRKGGDDLVEASVEENVRRVVERLTKAEALLQDAQAAGKLKVVGAVYSLQTGEVRWLD